MRQRHATLLLFVLCAFPLQAAKLSTKYEEWREGPAQWIMTSEEQKSWKALQSDEEAGQFIDLFWARRDPTPNTPLNEYRDEHESRVKIADAQYAEPRKRGALTDRGRTFIVLGMPSEGGTILSGSTMHTIGRSTAGNPRDGNRLRGAKDSWLWTNADAAKFDMSRVEVVFIEDPVSGKVQRDPQRPDFSAAAPVAIRKSIVSPDLAEVPAWAARNTVEAIAAPAAATASALDPASSLTFVSDIYALNAASKSDPFAKVTPVNAVAAPGQLGWLAKYCSGGEKPAALRYTVRISGPAGKRSKERLAAPENGQPEVLKSAPGCFLLRGLVGLEKMPAGQYEADITLQDPATGTGGAVRQSFMVE